MTENEIIKTLKGAYSLLLQCRVRFEDLNDYREASENAIKALEEVNEYRKIWTVEECREAVEKAKAKNPVPDESAYTINGITVYDTWYCPNCGQQYEKYYEEYKCCPECGQKIDWSSETEK